MINFGSWSFDSLWHLFISSFSVANIIGIAAILVAVFLPPALDAITGLRKWAIAVAVIAFGYSAVYTKGYDYGLSIKQAEWNKSIQQEAINGEKARDDAVATVRALPPDSVRHDGWNRDNWKQSGSK